MSGGSGNPQPADFFLDGSEPRTMIDFLAPPRRGTVVEPIIDGVATFTAMEESIAGATSSVYLALWIFNPRTPILSRAVRATGIRTWADLLRSAASRDVRVRVLLTDFDPLLLETNHRNNWLAYRRLVEEATRLGGTRDRLQVICSLHEATVRLGLGSRLERQRTDHIAYLNRLVKKKGVRSALDTFANWPGLWAAVAYQPKTKRFVARDDANLVAYPASHHQKMLIVDETTAYLGGLDVNRGRIGTPRHDRPDNFWHDLEAKLRGPAAVDACRAFAGRWNAEVPGFEAFIKSANATSPPRKMVLHPAKPDLAVTTMKAPVDGSGIVQIHLTRSVDSAWSVTPKTVREDVLRGYQRAIAHAREFIYIENQYVRAPELGQWLIDRARVAPELRVVIVLPVAPEEVGKTGKGDEITEHGLALQREIFVGLRRALKERVGIYSLIMNGKGSGASKTETHGSAQIYVHSKLLLVDDVYANIGSANANLRSFKIDTEITAAWYQPRPVKQLRLRLWREHLGTLKGVESWGPKEFVTRWSDIAQGNVRKPPGRRQGFVIPHDDSRFPGTKSGLIPDELAGIFDLERDQATDEPTQLA